MCGEEEACGTTWLCPKGVKNLIPLLVTDAVHMKSDFKGKGQRARQWQLAGQGPSNPGKTFQCCFPILIYFGPVGDLYVELNRFYSILISPARGRQC